MHRDSNQFIQAYEELKTMATATHHEKTFKSSIAVPERSAIIDILNARLADATDLKTQTKHAHWNVKGKDFIQLHELFDSIAPHFDEYADLIAERVAQLGGVAKGTLRGTRCGIKHSRIRSRGGRRT